MTLRVVRFLSTLDFLVMGVLSGFIFFDPGDDHGRGVFRPGDLDERVVMRLALFAGLAKVEVLAH